MSSSRSKALVTAAPHGGAATDPVAATMPGPGPGPSAASRLSASAPRARRRGQGQAFGWLCVTPYLVLLGLFGIGPLAYACYASIANPGGSQPSGLGGYSRAFSDFRFLPAVADVAEFMAIYLPMMVVGVILLALAVQEVGPRLGATMRLMYVLPGAVVGSASVLLWYVMLEPTLSPFGSQLRAMGFTTGAEVFQSSNLIWIFALMAFATGFGQWVVIIFGALQGVPEDQIEAARLDGCTWWQTARYVKLPAISKYVLYMVIMTFTAGLQIFVEPQLLYGLENVGSQWWSLNQLGLYYAFNNGDFAAASALSLLLLVVCAAAAGLLIFKARFFDTEVA